MTPTDNHAYARLCAVGGCDKKHHANGLCNIHYQRWRHHGTPDLIGHDMDMWAGGQPGNPWAGQNHCPACWSTRWALPLDAAITDRWRCVACHIEFTP